MLLVAIFKIPASDDKIQTYGISPKYKVFYIVLYQFKFLYIVRITYYTYNPLLKLQPLNFFIAELLNLKIYLGIILYLKYNL